MHAAREGFLATGTLDDGVRPLVADSWQRCLDLGVDPDTGPPVDLGQAELDAYRHEHALAEAMPLVRRLLVEDGWEAGLIVALADADGRLLWVEGASEVRRRAEGFGFVEGARWSERDAGTNAPGTALALDRPVQIFASEHLAGSATQWSCSAATVHDPQGRLLGAIDVTGGDDVAGPHALTLVRTVAAAVEAEMRLSALRTGGRRRPSVRQALTLPPGAPRAVQRSGGSASATRLHLLGHPTGELITSEGVTPLRLRHAEILFLLTLRPEGMTADQLAGELNERPTASVTLRAELSRLRELLSRHGDGVHVQGRPYGLSRPIDTDVAEVHRLLRRGALRRARAGYPGALLPRSTAPGVEAARERLRAEIRASLLAARDAELLWTFANSREGDDDLEIWEACCRALPATSRRLPAALARFRQLDQDWL